MRIERLLILNVLIFQMCRVCISQPKTDSLLNEITRTSDQKTLVDIHNELSHIYISYSYYKSQHHAQSALTIAERINYSLGNARASQLLGTTNWSHANYPVAIKYLSSAIILYDSLEFKVRKAECLNTMGLVYYYQSDYNNATDYLEDALKIFLEEGDSSKISRLYNNIGLVHQSKGEFDLSNNYIIEGLKYELKYTSIRDQFNSGNSRMKDFTESDVLFRTFYNTRVNLLSRENIYDKAGGYSEIGNLFKFNNNYDSAIFYFLEAQKIYQSLGEKSKQCLQLIEIGDCYSSKSEWDSATVYYERSLPIAFSEYLSAPYDGVLLKLGDLEKNIGNNKRAIDYYTKGLIFSDSVNHQARKSIYLQRISSVLLLNNEFEKAIITAKNAYDFAKTIESFVQIKNSAQVLAMAYEANSVFDQALNYQRIFYDLEREQENAQNERVKMEFQAKFELQEKAGEILTLSNENEIIESKLKWQRVYISVSVIGFVIVLGFTFVLRMRIRKEKELNKKVNQKNKENELLLKEIHHRVKNNLQMVSSILSMQGRRLENDHAAEILRLTKNRILTIGMIHEHLYNDENLSLIRFDSYVPELVSMILKSSNDRKIPKIYYHFDFEVTEIDLMIPIALIINELVTNSVKYAFGGIDEPEMRIKISAANEMLILKVSDNGPGFNEEQKGFGWTIIESLVNGLGGSIELSQNSRMEVSILIKKST